MARRTFCYCIAISILCCLPKEFALLVIPEDVPTGLVAVYGFAPRIVKGSDHRLGFGFRLGNHADFQILYEFGPQTITRPIQPLRVRSASYRQRVARRRPFIDFLLKTGLLREISYEFNVVHDNTERDDEPR